MAQAASSSPDAEVKSTAHPGEGWSDRQPIQRPCFAPRARPYRTFLELENKSMSKPSRIERLGEMMSRRREDSARLLYERGSREGRYWAESCEDIDGLRRLQQIRQDGGDFEWDNMFAGSDLDRKVKLIKLALLLHPAWRKDDDWLKAEQWIRELKSRVEYNVHHPAFMWGFVDGALSVSDETDSER